MKYLLDVNALLAWEHDSSSHHLEFHTWVKKVNRSNLWTCAFTELGFLRVSMQVFHYNLEQAAASPLAILKKASGEDLSAKHLRQDFVHGRLLVQKHPMRILFRSQKTTA